MENEEEFSEEYLERFDRIDNYVFRRLSEDEERAFEQDVENDPVLAHEFWEHFTFVMDVKKALQCKKKSEIRCKKTKWKIFPVLIRF
ncbi:MAG: hypothetical protein K9H64_15345 [Bacteroidales bacterium]|nr:hypothetical protein [Bacteroidales bacterium]MCF8457332.1 hypothetical protein [Bacteroidales bacterium]